MICTSCNKRQGKTKNARFCNSCYVAKYRKLYPHKKYEYGGQRWLVLKRDNYQCQACGKTKDEVKLSIHHIDGKGSQVTTAEQNNDPDNLITACPACHYQLDYTRRGYHTNRGPRKALNQWSLRYDRCIICGTTEHYHAGKGLCKKCYYSQYSKMYKRTRRPGYYKLWPSYLRKTGKMFGAQTWKQIEAYERRKSDEKAASI